MVKIIVDKIDGHIVYLRYFEEMDENRMGFTPPRTLSTRW